MSIITKPSPRMLSNQCTLGPNPVGPALARPRYGAAAASLREPPPRVVDAFSIVAPMQVLLDPSRPARRRDRAAAVCILRTDPRRS